MALLRILLLGLLILLVVRLLVRLGKELARRAERSSGEARAGDPRTRSPNRPRQLVACPVCGTYFERHRGLTIPARSEGGRTLEVCCDACRLRHRESATARPASGDGERR